MAEENSKEKNGRFEISYRPEAGGAAGSVFVENFDDEFSTLSRACELRSAGHRVNISIGQSYAHEFPEFSRVNGLMISKDPVYQGALTSEAGVEIVHLASSVRLLNGTNKYGVSDLLDIVSRWHELEDPGESADEVSAKVGIAFLAILPEIVAELRRLQAIDEQVTQILERHGKQYDVKFSTN